MHARDVISEQVERFKRDGYLVVPGALTPEELAPIHKRFHELMPAVVERETREKGYQPMIVELTRIIERDPVFEPLMDWHRTFPLVRAILGRDVTLATAGEASVRAPHSDAFISWHNDWMWMADVPYPRQNFWVRCTYFIDDVEEGQAPFTLLPGSHLYGGPPPKDHTDERGQPKDIPGMVRITGKAGTCMLNNTEIWHTNTPNTTDRPRNLIMFVYKHAWMRPWEEGYEVSPEFAARQTDPVRKQLCGQGVWHRIDEKWEAEAVGAATG